MKRYLLPAFALFYACAIPDRVRGVAPEDSRGNDAGIDAAPGPDASPSDAPDGGGEVDAARPSLALTLGAAQVAVVRGGSATLAVGVAASDGFTGVVSVNVAGLPSGVKADPLVVDVGPKGGTLVLRADLESPLSVDGKLSITAIRGAVASPTVTLPIIVQDSPGSLDTTFGNGGVAVVTIPKATDSALGPRGLAIQPSGQIVFTGDVDIYQLLVGRLTPDGQLDTSFATGGFFTTNSIGFDTEVGSAITAIPGGGVAVGGFAHGATSANHSIFVAKLTDAGVLDGAFAGGAGVLALDDGSVDAKGTDIALQPDGKIVIGGYRPWGVPVLARITPTGGADPTFDPSPAGQGPIGLNGYPDAGAAINALALLPSGALLATTDSTSFLTYRITTTGSIDTAFGVGGAANAAGTLTSSAGLLLQPGGKSIVVGSTASTIELTRFEPSGKLDTTFGTAGRVSTSLAESRTIVPRGAAMMADGRFVVTAQLQTKAPLAVFRYAADGALDTTFGGVGYVGISASGAPTQEPIAVDAVGRIVIAAASGGHVMVARFWP